MVRQGRRLVAQRRSEVWGGFILSLHFLRGLKRQQEGLARNHRFSGWYLGPCRSTEDKSLVARDVCLHTGCLRHSVLTFSKYLRMVILLVLDNSTCEILHAASSPIESVNVGNMIPTLVYGNDGEFTLVRNSDRQGRINRNLCINKPPAGTTESVMLSVNSRCSFAQDLNCGCWECSGLFSS